LESQVLTNIYQGKDPTYFKMLGVLIFNCSPNVRQGSRGVTQRRQRGKSPPGKINEKTEPPHSLYFGFNFL